MKKMPQAKMSSLTFLKLAKHNLIDLRTQLFQQYGDIFLYKIKGTMNCYIMHPDHIRYILKDNQDNYLHRHSLLTKTFCPFTGKGINFNNNPIEWHRDRVTAMLCFEPSIYFTDYANTVTKTIEKALKNWQNKYKDGDSININHEVSEFIIDIVATTLFTQIVVDAKEVTRIILDVIDVAKKKLYTLPILWNFSFKKKSHYQDALKRVKTFSRALVDQRVEKIERWDDIIGYLQHEYSHFSPNEISALLGDQIITLFAVSYFTTTALLQWIFVELSKHPEAERQIKYEIDKVVGERLPKYSDISSLHYLSAFIKEVLRLHPTLFGIMRETKSEDMIDGFTIKKNTGIIISTYHVHRHPEFWNNPEGFDPERFLNNSLGQDNSFAYIPFGSGKRRCIGPSFSTLEAILITVMILQKCHLTLLPCTKVKTYITTPISMRPDVNEMQIKWL